MADFAVRFADWGGGHAGVRDPALAERDQWYGSNVAVYTNGLLGPRWALGAIPVSGVANIPIVHGPQALTVIGKYLYVVTDKLYRIPVASLLTATAAAPAVAEAYVVYPATPSSWVTIIEQEPNLVFSLAGNTVYKHQNLGTAAVATPAPLRFLRRWNLYAVGVDHNQPNRLWHSRVDENGYSFSDWPVDAYLDIGDQEPITALVPAFNTLYVGKRSGWWAVSGALGFTAYARAVILGNGPVDQRGAANSSDNRIGYWPHDNIPALFNTARIGLLDDQRVPERYDPQGTQGVAVSPTGRVLLFGYDIIDEGGVRTTNALGLHPGGRITPFAFDERLVGFAPDVVEGGYDLPPGYVLTARQASVVGTPFQLYGFAIEYDRPARVQGDLWGQHNPAMECNVATRAFYEPEGRQLRVRSVIIHFRHWNLDDPDALLDNSFEVYIEAIGAYEGDTNKSKAQHWIEPTGSSRLDGLDDSVRFNYGDQGFANAFRIHIDSMHGIAVREVIVLCDVRTTRT